MRTAVLLSISQIAAEFGMARLTVSKAIEALGIRPSEKRAGYPVYRLADVIRILSATEIDSQGRVDPSKLKPQDRRAWFQSENERLKFEQEQGQLILASEVHSEMAAIAKIVVRALETLPDTVERDIRCGAEVVEYLQRKIREVRSEIANRIADEEGDDVRASA